MSTISPATQRLDVLGHQVRAAENKLQKMPGSRSMGVYIELEEMQEKGKDCFLMYGIPDDTQDGSEGICVQVQDNNGQTNRAFHRLPISQRILVAEQIPDLIDAAESAEEDLASRAIHIAETIQQRLAKFDR